MEDIITEPTLSSVDEFDIWLQADIQKQAADALLPFKARRGRKPTKKMYFTYITDQAIHAYNLEDSYAKKNRIYRDHIHYAFDKLAENIIHTFKFYYFDVPYNDVKSEVVAFLNEKIHKYNLIIANNANYAKLKQKADVITIDDARNLGTEQMYSDYQETLKDFTDLFVEYYTTNMNVIFTNKRDIIVADTLIELFRIRENIENFNKKALYILIRERTGLKTQNITKVVNIMKKQYAKMYKTFNAHGHIGNHIL